MTINTRKLNTITNVQAGEVATLEVPTGARMYHRLEIQVSDTNGIVSKANMKTFFENIKVSVFGDAYGSLDLIDLKSADFFENVLDFYNVQYEDGLLIIPFVVDHFENPLKRLGSALGTSDLRSCEVEFTIASGVVAPKLTAYAVYDRVARPMGMVRRFHYQTFNVSAAGDYQISNPSIMGQLGLKALHFTTSKITDVEVKTNDLVIREAPLAILKRENQFRATHEGRTEGAGYTHIDFAGDDGDRIVNMARVNDFQLKLAMSGSENQMRMIAETVVGAGNSI